MTGKRAFDIAVSASVLLALSPLLALTALGIRLSSPGPVFYPARRVGRGGAVFRMLKFRSMHMGQGGAVITGPNDARVFPFGRVIRAAKLDELPQFWNVLTGEMSIVGPRPEDPKIVETAYTPWMRETLEVRPGITGPGSILYYSYGEALLDPDDPEGSYVARLLPPKLAVERAYMDRATVGLDAIYAVRTLVAILGVVAGRPVRPLERDVDAARAWAEIALAPASRGTSGATSQTPSRAGAKDARCRTR